MHYKQFGNSGMQISSMALGTWGIGGTGWDDNPESTRIDAIQAAVESGITFLIRRRPIIMAPQNERLAKH